MDKVIFLDFDGVINDNFKVHKENKETLKTIIKQNNPRFVLITSWQGLGETVARENITRYLKKYLEGITLKDIEFINPRITPVDGTKYLYVRALGIIEYLKTHPDIYYTILDDDYKEEYEKLNLNHFQTNPSKGLQPEDISKIHFIKNNINNLDTSIEYNIEEISLPKRK